MSVWGVEACASEDIYAWDKVEGATTFTRVTLTDHNSGKQQWKHQLHRKMWDALDKIKPQVVVVPGWSFTDALSALLWCAETNTPTVVMSESMAGDESRVAWKEWIKRRLVNLNSAGLVGGKLHCDYLIQLGLGRERIFLGYDVVDNEHFHRKADEARHRDAEVRSRLGLPNQYFLASARFVEKKNLLQLIQAYGRYRTLVKCSGTGNTKIWSLVLLGDGPIKSAIKKLISELGLESSVHLPGFKQYDELPAYLGLAGAFVHASTTEQWGLVVNEAMAASLPVLVSNRCGCGAELVLPGVNGFQFDPVSVDELAHLFLKLSGEGFPLVDFGAASKRIVSNWGPERFANGLHDAIDMALKNPRPTAGVFDRFVLRLLLRR